MGCSIEFAISSCFAHTKHLDGMFYVIIYLKSRWWWRQLPPLLPPSNANHLFWHSISQSFPLSLFHSPCHSKAKEGKNFLTFQQSLCRLINLMLYTEIQTHLLAFTHTPRVSFGRTSSSPSPPPPLNHRPFKWTLFKNHQAAINKYFSNDWFSLPLRLACLHSKREFRD